MAAKKTPQLTRDQAPAMINEVIDDRDWIVYRTEAEQGGYEVVLEGQSAALLKTLMRERFADQTPPPEVSTDATAKARDPRERDRKKRPAVVGGFCAPCGRLD